ncbi:unnamed protein product [Spodoptera exigua]|nr:unnamed protein product [Spodoptera exigua]
MVADFAKMSMRQARWAAGSVRASRAATDTHQPFDNGRAGALMKYSPLRYAPGMENRSGVPSARAQRSVMTQHLGSLIASLGTDLSRRQFEVTRRSNVVVGVDDERPSFEILGVIRTKPTITAQSNLGRPVSDAKDRSLPAAATTLLYRHYLATVTSSSRPVTTVTPAASLC